MHLRQDLQEALTEFYERPIRKKYRIDNLLYVVIHIKHLEYTYLKSILRNVCNEFSYKIYCYSIFFSFFFLLYTYNDPCKILQENQQRVNNTSYIV